MIKKKMSLAKQKEYTFLKYENALFYEQNAQQSLFNGSILKNCEIDTNDFSQCDFEGTIFFDTVFNNSKLVSCDIKSSYFTRCIFINCTFDVSAIIDTDFIECKFEKCSFDDTMMRDLTFKQCTIIDCTFKMSTFVLSKFTLCTLKKLVLGNCSFYDHIMNKCSYNNIVINIDTIGRIYGLKLTDLKEFKYIFLGKIYGFAPDKFFEQLDQIFQSKEWHLQRLLYKYNIEKISSYEYIISVFDTLAYFITSNIIVKRDDLHFLVNIITQMKEECKVPLFALYQGIEILSRDMKYLLEEDYINKEDIFREFINKLCFLFHDSLNDYLDLLPENLSPEFLSQKALLKIHYEGNTEINFSKYINYLLENTGYDSIYFCQLTEVKKGSIIEIIVGSILSVYALQLLLYGINGVLVQLTDMLSKLSVIKNKNYQKDYLSNSVKGRQKQPELIEKTFDLLKDKQFKENINSLAPALSKSSIIDIVTSLEKENTL